MGFDDFFENRNSYQGDYKRRKYFDDDSYSHNSQAYYHKHPNNIKWLAVSDKIRSSKKLRRLLLVAVIIFLALVVVFFYILYPFIAKLYNYVIQNGLQSVFNDITGFIEKLWSGSKN